MDSNHHFRRTRKEYHGDLPLIYVGMWGRSELNRRPPRLSTRRSALSYFPMSPRLELNQRPTVSCPAALLPELRGREVTEEVAGY